MFESMLMRNDWNVFCYVLLCMGIALSLVFWQWVIKVVLVGSLYQYSGLCLILK